MKELAAFAQETFSFPLMRIAQQKGHENHVVSTTKVSFTPIQRYPNSCAWGVKPLESGEWFKKIRFGAEQIYWFRVDGR